MDSFNNESPLAIRFQNVRKVYRLYDSVGEQALDVLGLAPLRFWRPIRFREFTALKDISLDVGHGERVGVIGRNGAGKSTLLKLLTGNFAPSAGTVRVEGAVQALMQVGLGFHPEFTGFENVQASLAYNGLQGNELTAAIEDVVDFVELGEFLDQPVKTYSMGMLSRLQFAAATAVKPDILVIDEMLGAGDAYFSAKSADRMGRLARSGCTLLLVSHASGQIMQFCDRVVWLEEGAIVMDGAPLAVIKAYEEFTQRLERARYSAAGVTEDGSIIHKPWLRKRLLKDVLHGSSSAEAGYAVNAVHENGANISEGGISRYAAHDDGLRIVSVRVLGVSGQPTSVLQTGEEANIEIEVEGEKDGKFPCHFVILLFTEDGRWLSRHCSERCELTLASGERRIGRLSLDEVRLGAGRYVFSAAIYSELNLKDPSTSRFYDLLTRSFEFRVLGPYPDDPSIFYHPAKWVLPKTSTTHSMCDSKTHVKEGGK